MSKPEITLRVPGEKSWALVLRLALGGVAILKDMDAGTLDDLRQASDEACDCLLHQPRKAAQLTLNVNYGGDCLTVSIAAEFEGECSEACENETDISRAVLETLIPVVSLETDACGCVSRIDLTLRKAVAVGA